MTARIHLAAALMLSLLFLPGCGGTGEGAPAATPPEQASTTQESAEAEAEAEAEEQPLSPLRSIRVTLYFPSVYHNALVGEPREIFETASPGDRAKQILADLLAGPESTGALRATPPGIRLRQVYFVEGGVAYTDFSVELANRTRGGSMEELLTVYAIVNSVAMNIPEIDRVAILVDGKPCESLSGHVDLRRPLPPDPSMILRSGRRVS